MPRSEESYSGVVIRLNKARDATEFAVAVARSRLSDAGPLVIFGGNDEGIRSTREVAGVKFESVEAGGHGRVLIGHTTAGARRELSEYRRVVEVSRPGQGSRPWISYPGCFARGGVDRGTATLLSTLDDLAPPVRVLDFATGTGVIAAAVRARWPAAAVTGCDSDTLALSAAAENVPGARFLVGDGLAAVGKAQFELILSNPPFHEGKARAERVWREFLEGVPPRLVPSGELRIVVQREVAVGPVLGALFAEVRQLLISGGFVVWSARRPRTVAQEIRATPTARASRGR